MSDRWGVRKVIIVLIKNKKEISLVSTIVSRTIKEIYLLIFLYIVEINIIVLLLDCSDERQDTIIDKICGFSNFFKLILFF